MIVWSQISRASPFHASRIRLLRVKKHSRVFVLDERFPPNKVRLRWKSRNANSVIPEIGVGQVVPIKKVQKMELGVRCLHLIDRVVPLPVPVAFPRALNQNGYRTLSHRNDSILMFWHGRKVTERSFSHTRVDKSLEKQALDLFELVTRIPVSQFLHSPKS